VKGFVALAVVTGGIVYLQFLLAHRVWRRTKGIPSLIIDSDYVRLEEYLAHSFRARIETWRRARDAHATAYGSRRTADQPERVRFIDGIDLPAGAIAMDVLVVDGDLTCGERSELHREVFVRGRATIAGESRLQAIAADRELTLGSGATVARWADAEGTLVLGTAAHVEGRATSRTEIRMHRGSAARSVYAPSVSTAAAGDEAESASGPERRPSLPVDSELAPERRGGEVFHAGSLRELSADCWIYDGHLRLQRPVRLKSDLIVRGDFEVPAGSILEGSVKARGSLRVGAHSRCRGNLVAGGAVTLENGTSFEGIIYAGGTIRLASGVRGVANRHAVAVYAGETVLLAPNVILQGKAAAGVAVIAEGPRVGAVA
jgi:predicted acyltransferase (DUF342 family)